MEHGAESYRIKRTRTENFSPSELDLIYDILAPRYTEWMTTTIQGGNRKYMKTPRQILVEDIVNSLACLDGAVERTPTQVSNRIRDDLVKLRKAITDSAGNIFGTSGVPPHLSKLEIILRRECSVSDIMGGHESRESSSTEAAEPIFDIKLEDNGPISPLTLFHSSPERPVVAGEERTLSGLIGHHVSKGKSRHRKPKKGSALFLRNRCLKEKLQWWSARADLARLELQLVINKAEEQTRRQQRESEEYKIMCARRDEEHQAKMRLQVAKTKFYELLCAEQRTVSSNFQILYKSPVVQPH